MNRISRQSLASVPGIGFALLPKLACPLCWPAYAAVLSSVGLGFLISTKYLLPLTATFLVLSLGALAFRARCRHGYGPFFVALVATIAVMFGKFAWDSKPTLYAGIAILIAASLWNAWPEKMARNENSNPCCSEHACGMNLKEE